MNGNGNGIGIERSFLIQCIPCAQWFHSNKQWREALILFVETRFIASLAGL